MSLKEPIQGLTVTLWQPSPHHFAEGEEHVHPCPECYQLKTCTQTCSPADGADDVRKYGAPVLCDECHAWLNYDFKQGKLEAKP